MDEVDKNVNAMTSNEKPICLSADDGDDSRPNEPLPSDAQKSGSSSSSLRTAHKNSSRIGDLVLPNNNNNRKNTEPMTYAKVPHSMQMDASVAESIGRTASVIGGSVFSAYLEPPPTPTTTRSPLTSPTLALEKPKKQDQASVRRKQLSDLLKISKRIEADMRRINEIELHQQTKPQESLREDIATLASIENEMDKLEEERNALQAQLDRNGGFAGLFKPDENLHKLITRKSKQLAVLNKQQRQLSKLAEIHEENIKELEQLRKDVEFFQKRRELLETNLGDHLKKTNGKLRAAKNSTLERSCSFMSSRELSRSVSASSGRLEKRRKARTRHNHYHLDDEHDRNADAGFRFSKSSKFQTRPVITFSHSFRADSNEIAESEEVSSFVHSSNDKKKGVVSSLLVF